MYVRSRSLADCIHWAWVIACCPSISYFLKEKLRKSLFPSLQDLGGFHIYFLRIAFIIQRRSCVMGPEWIPEWRCFCCHWLAAVLLMSSMTIHSSLKSVWVAFVHWEFSKTHCVAHFRHSQGSLSGHRPVTSGLLGHLLTPSAPCSSFSRSGWERFKTTWRLLIVYIFCPAILLPRFIVNKTFINT